MGIFDLWPWGSDDQMPAVNRAFNKVRQELSEVGLLDDGVYLDQIDCTVEWLPSLFRGGRVFEETNCFCRFIGYEEGSIYLPSNLPHDAYVPGETLTDIIRHEFAHAWHWLEPSFFKRRWFGKTFDAGYDDEVDETNEDWQELRNDYVSEYATTQPSEDFAETFMMYLRYRNSLSRFKNRPGVYRKLKGVERAVDVARRELGL